MKETYRELGAHPQVPLADQSCYILGAGVVLREEQFQPLVAPALCAVFSLRLDHLHFEVKTRDGSIADIVSIQKQRVIVFELKIAEPGEVLRGLDARATRQIRHYRQAADEVYLVTLAAPRTYHTEGPQVMVREPLEAQLLPDGVGWVVFDTLTQTATLLRPAAAGQPRRQDREFLCDGLLGRLGKTCSAVQRVRCVGG